MKITEWAKREDLQIQWKKLWETEEPLKEGFSVLLDVALPAETRVPTGTDAIQHNALMNARREGYYDALRNIEALKEVRKPQNPLPDPWSEPKQEE